MRCHICDNILSAEEIKHEQDHGNWAPCTACIIESGTSPKFTSIEDLLIDPEFDEQVEALSVQDLRLL